jgi:hypothetical protein
VQVVQAVVVPSGKQLLEFQEQQTLAEAAAVAATKAMQVALAVLVL